MRLPKKLTDWAAQCEGAMITEYELEFLRAVNRAADFGVGFGWMQQVIEWAWQEQSEIDGLPGSSWGPEYFGTKISDLSTALEATESASMQSESLHMARIKELKLSVGALKEQLEHAIEIFEGDPECNTFGTSAWDWLHISRAVIGQINREESEHAPQD